MKYSLELTIDLQRNPYKGKYFVIEGIDGSGKSTQIEKIQDHLQSLGREVVVTSEPMATGTIQTIIRGALFSKFKLPTRSYQALYSADRAVNHATIVEPALQEGKIVLSHRSNWSTIPHGIIDLGENYSFTDHAWPIAVANGLLSSYHEFLIPDIAFYLKVSAKKAIERLFSMSKAKDIYEKEEKLAKIARGYDQLIAQFPEEFVIIDGEKEEEEVTKEIVKHINELT